MAFFGMEYLVRLWAAGCRLKEISNNSLKERDIKSSFQVKIYGGGGQAEVCKEANLCDR